MSGDPEVPVGLFIERLMVTGGASQDLVNLACGLLTTRFRPTVFIWEGTGSELEAILDREHIELRRMTRRFRFDPSPMVRVARLFRTGSLTIAHGVLPRANFCVSVAGALARRSVVLSVKDEQEGTLPPLARFLTTSAYRLGSVIVPNSESGEQHLRVQFPRVGTPTQVIHQGVDLERFRPARVEEKATARSALGIDPNVTTFLTVGRFEPIKNHAGLVRAFGDLPRPHRFHAIMVGRATDERERVVDLIANLGLSEVIHVPDAIPDIERLYRAADVLVHPSLTEALPNAVLEGMASGLPVVAYDTGDIGSLVRSGATGWLVPRGVHSALVAALRDSLEVPTERLREIGLRGRDRVVDLDLGLDSYVRRHAELYEALLDGRSRGAGTPTSGG